MQISKDENYETLTDLYLGIPTAGISPGQSRIFSCVPKLIELVLDFNFQNDFYLQTQGTEMYLERL